MSEIILKFFGLVIVFLFSLWLLITLLIWYTFWHFIPEISLTISYILTFIIAKYVVFRKLKLSLSLFFRIIVLALTFIIFFYGSLVFLVWILPSYSFFISLLFALVLVYLVARLILFKKTSAVVNTKFNLESNPEVCMLISLVFILSFWFFGHNYDFFVNTFVPYQF